jgi:hypothetical protein
MKNMKLWLESELKLVMSIMKNDFEIRLDKHTNGQFIVTNHRGQQQSFNEFIKARNAFDSSLEFAENAKVG